MASLALLNGASKLSFKHKSCSLFKLFIDCFYIQNNLLCNFSFRPQSFHFDIFKF